MQPNRMILFNDGLDIRIYLKIHEIESHIVTFHFLYLCDRKRILKTNNDIEIINPIPLHIVIDINTER